MRAFQGEAFCPRIPRPRQAVRPSQGRLERAGSRGAHRWPRRIAPLVRLASAATRRTVTDRAVLSQPLVHHACHLDGPDVAVRLRLLVRGVVAHDVSRAGRHSTGSRRCQLCGWRFPVGQSTGSPWSTSAVTESPRPSFPAPASISGSSPFMPQRSRSLRNISTRHLTSFLRWPILRTDPLCSLVCRCEMTFVQHHMQTSEYRLPTSSFSSIRLSQPTAPKSRRRSAAACSRDQVQASSQ